MIRTFFTWFRNRLGLRWKLLTMAVPPLVLLAYFSGNLLLLRIETFREFTEIEQTVALYLRVNDLVHVLQQERGLSASFLGSPDNTFLAPMREKRAAVDESTAQFAGTGTNQKTFEQSWSDVSDFDGKTANDRERIMEKLRQLPRVRSGVDNRTLDVATELAFYSDLILSLLRLQDGNSTHVRDPAIMRFLFALQFLARFKEAAGLERAMMGNLLARQASDPVVLQRLHQKIVEQNEHEISFRFFASRSLTNSFDRSRRTPAYREILRVREAVVDRGDAAVVSPQDWWRVATARIDALRATELRGSRLLLDTLSGRRARIVGDLALHAVLMLLPLGLSVLVFLVISRMILRSMGEVGFFAQKIAAGNLRVKLPDAGQDEIGAMFESLSGMSRELAGILENIRTAIGETTHLAGRAKKLAESFDTVTTSLATTTEEAAAANEELLSSVENVTNFVEQTEKSLTALEQGSLRLERSFQAVNEAMAELARRADESARKGEHGRAAIDRIQTAMGGIHESTSRIGEIVGLIREISDQTNLLALNASIEAARAGDQGRGFAVVASEISRLADRTLRSVKEIDRLIADLRTQVGAGAHETGDARSVVHELGGTMEGMQATARRVQQGLDAETSRLGDFAREIHGLSNLSREISRASREQRRAVSELNQTIQNVSVETQSTASGSGELALIGRQLNDQAGRLAGLIARFSV